MKTTLVIEINTKDEYNDIFPEDGQSEDEFEGKENELKDFRKEYADNMHSNLVKYVKGHLTEDVLESYLTVISQEVDTPYTNAILTLEEDQIKE